MLSQLETWALNNNINFSVDHHIRCFAHVVNLSVQSALKELKNEIDQVRNLIIKCRSSPQRRQKFKEISNLNNISLSPILDVSTRWNSTYEMINRALELKVVSIFN
jgi:hypothetical protein